MQLEVQFLLGLDRIFAWRDNDFSVAGLDVREVCPEGLGNNLKSLIPLRDACRAVPAMVLDFVHEVLSKDGYGLLIKQGISVARAVQHEFHRRGPSAIR